MLGTFDRNKFAERLAALSRQGVFIGTSSWKYEGWRGMLYDDARYVSKGRFIQARFERNCLTEYAEVFKTVSVDAAYYRFPTHEFIEEMAGQVPEDFRFALKVTDTITLRTFPALAKFGGNAGKRNERFLNAELFQADYLNVLEPFRQKISFLMFEFARFHPRDFERGRDFLSALDEFLGQLPKTWRYGVELRNHTFLQPEYFAVLRRHGVTHIFNNWEAMPPVSEQMALADSRTTPDLSAARLLLKPGRRYEEAVKLFSPYTRIQEPNPDGRTAAVRLVAEAARSAGRERAFIYVNNRFEGNALETIEAILIAAG